MTRDPNSRRETIQTRRLEHKLEGRDLGNYQVLHRIGRGGMGDIYLAMHTRLGGQVAIKVLRPDLALRQDVVERFFNEARAVNQIGHPNIVNIIDFVEEYDQSPPLVYMVMEYLQGRDLSNYLHLNSPLPPAEAVNITLEVAKALQAVHAVQILHRDLKPENIFLIDNDDDAHRIKLLDFGVARAYGDQRAQPLTDPGTTIGTPEYMAPEQVSAGPLDARTDIYALGVVLYEMLAGKVPYSAGSIGEIFVKVLNEHPEHISSEMGGSSPVDIRLEALVFRCMLKDPALRFQSAKDLHSALESYLQEVRAPREFASGGTEAFRPTHVSSMSDYEEYEPPVGLKWKRLIVLGLVLFGAVAGLMARLVIGGGEEPTAVKTATYARPDGGAKVAAAAPKPSPDASVQPDLAAPEEPAPARAKAAPKPRPKRSPPRAKPSAKARPKKPARGSTKKPARGSTKKPARGSTKKKVDITHGTMDPFAD